MEANLNRILDINAYTRISRRIKIKSFYLLRTFHLFLTGVVENTYTHYQSNLQLNILQFVFAISYLYWGKTTWQTRKRTWTISIEVKSDVDIAVFDWILLGTGLSFRSERVTQVCVMSAEVFEDLKSSVMPGDWLSPV